MKSPFHKRARTLAFVSLLAVSMAAGAAVQASSNIVLADNASITTASSGFAEIQSVNVVTEQGKTLVSGNLKRHRVLPPSRVGYLYIIVTNKNGDLLLEKRARITRSGHQRSHDLRFAASLPLVVSDQDSITVVHHAEHPGQGGR